MIQSTKIFICLMVMMAIQANSQELTTIEQKATVKIDTINVVTPDEIVSNPIKIYTQEEIIKADTTTVMYEGKLRPSLQYVVDVDFKRLKKHWKDFLSKTYDTSAKTESSKYLVTKDLIIKTISDMRMDLLVAINTKDLQSKVDFSGAFGYDIYIDAKNYKEELAAFKIMVEKFLNGSLFIYYSEMIIEVSDEIAKPTKKNVNLKSDITQLNDKITEAEDLISSIKESEDAESDKTLKKINKLVKKQENYALKINDDNNEILVNEAEIKALTKKKEIYTAKKKALQN